MKITSLSAVCLRSRTKEQRAKLEVREVAKSLKTSEASRSDGLPKMAVKMLVLVKSFNNACWDAISVALKKMGVSSKLRTMADYFRDCVLIYDTEKGLVRTRVSVSVPQISVLGATFWKVIVLLLGLFFSTLVK